MHGKYRVMVENAYVRYEFEITRNITIIRGQSATGKTTLFEMIRSYQEEEESGITIRCDRPLAAVYGRDWKTQIESTESSIIFIDEQSRFVKSKEFADLIRYSDNYYVIITREKLSELPYSITEIYGIRLRGKYAGLTGEYAANEFYRIYGEKPAREFKPDIVITEDSNSGHDFWDAVMGSGKCISAEGKSKVLSKLKALGANGTKYLAVVDGAAFGPEMEEMLQYIKYNNNDIEIFAPESFEYMLLTSGLFHSKEIEDRCMNTADHADSLKYFSWEQFYTSLLTEVTQNTEMKYSKKELNIYYLSKRNMNMILEKVPDSLLFDVEQGG